MKKTKKQNWVTDYILETKHVENYPEFGPNWRTIIERPRSLNSAKATTVAICPIMVHFFTQRVLMPDVVSEFACAVRMPRNN